MEPVDQARVETVEAIEVPRAVHDLLDGQADPIGAADERETAQVGWGRPIRTAADCRSRPNGGRPWLPGRRWRVSGYLRTHGRGADPVGCRRTSGRCCAPTAGAERATFEAERKDRHGPAECRTKAHLVLFRPTCSFDEARKCAGRGDDGQSRLPVDIRKRE
ncbi:hypothetical protein GCM10011588_34520 [Nocardia jinanensis]|uniref:Uncharacterized protein n=1 Tax=Nocardia jinanensis TaxID=382504 RepID=A0A917RP75_9NOCA|nr:hypothetical protein GCM10011588_34520 [Nocardia jinanensis]